MVVEINGSGNAAHGWVQFKTTAYDPLNTAGLEPYVHPFPPGFEVRSNYYGGFNYSIEFRNYTSMSYEYNISTSMGSEKKGVFARDVVYTLSGFNKDVSYRMTLTNENWGERYEIEWYVNSMLTP